MLLSINSNINSKYCVTCFVGLFIEYGLHGSGPNYNLNLQCSFINIHQKLKSSQPPLVSHHNIYMAQRKWYVSAVFSEVTLKALIKIVAKPAV